MAEPTRAQRLRRRRRVRVAGSAAVLAAVVVLALLGGRPAPRAAPGPAGEEEVHLPSGCTSERPRRAARPLPRRAPDLVLEAGRDYRAVVHTSCGDISINLLEGRAPRNVANFVGLARRGFYDGLTWHRVEADVVVQSGDPNGRNLAPPDGPPYEVPDEIAGVRGRDYVYGVVGMANAGPDTAGSQFFIVVHDHDGALERDPEPAGLQPDYTIFGRVDRSSWPALERLASVPVRGGLDLVKAVEPVIPVYIESIDVGGSR